MNFYPLTSGLLLLKFAKTTVEDRIEILGKKSEKKYGEEKS